MIFGSDIGWLGLSKQAFGMEGIAKINFCRNWISYDSRVDFSWFWAALGPIFITLVALSAGLKFDNFSKGEDSIDKVGMYKFLLVIHSLVNQNDQDEFGGEEDDEQIAHDMYHAEETLEKS